jgi:hypothetical protein
MRFCLKCVGGTCVTQHNLGHSVSHGNMGNVICILALAVSFWNKSLSSGTAFDMKIVVLHCRNTWEFHAELRAALHYCALLYPTVAGWVQVFEGAQHCTLLSYHMHVCGYNWKVPGWRQELDCEGISKAYRHLWVHSASFFITGLKSAQFCSQVWCASGDTLWEMSYQSGTVMPQTEQHDKSDNCNWWNMSRGVCQNSNSSPPSRIVHIHHEIARLDKICCPQNWWLFWPMTFKVFLCVIQFNRVKLWIWHYLYFVSPVSRTDRKCHHFTQ